MAPGETDASGLTADVDVTDEGVREQGVSPRRIPQATVVRLPIYRRLLEEFGRSGLSTVSSEMLAAAAHMNAAKVRKDLSLLGSFGTRGSGYDRDFLIGQIDLALGLDRVWPVVIVGMGNLGRALANSTRFAGQNFEVVAMLDADPDLVGQEVANGVIRPFGELGAIASSRSLAIGVVTTPADVAQDAADQLVAAGVHSLLVFAPRVIDVPRGVMVRYVDLGIELQVMSFYQSRRERQGEDHDMPVLGSVGLAGPPGN